MCVVLREIGNRMNRKTKNKNKNIYCICFCWKICSRVWALEISFPSLSHAASGIWRVLFLLNSPQNIIKYFFFPLIIKRIPFSLRNLTLFWCICPQLGLLVPTLFMGTNLNSHNCPRDLEEGHPEAKKSLTCFNY